MKKSFLGVVTLSMLFGAMSCSTEIGETSPNKGEAVSFSVGMKSQKQTRVQEVSLDHIKEDADLESGSTLDVYAFSATSNSLAHKFELVWDPTINAWKDTHGTVFQQPGYALSYYATYPSYSENDGNITDPQGSANDYTFKYTVQSDVVNNQEDLLGASAGPTIAHDIKLQFKHLLSEVNFAVQGLSGIDIDITAITVRNVHDQGTYSFANGWRNTGLSGDSGTYIYPSNADEITNLKSGNYSDIRYLGNNKSTGYTHNNAMMLMPQKFDDSNNGSFLVKFSLSETGTGTVVASDKTATVFFRDFAANEWEPGKRYIYLIDFSSYFANGEVKFTVEVNDFENAADNSETAQVVQVSAATAATIHDAITLQSANKKANTTLLRFPVHVVDKIPETITISPTLDNFIVGDAVLIECIDEASANFIKLGQQTTSAPYWVPSTSGSVVTLTMTAAAAH
jgi:hypothetical protein